MLNRIRKDYRDVYLDFYETKRRRAYYYEEDDNVVQADFIGTGDVRYRFCGNGGSNQWQPIQRSC